MKILRTCKKCRLEAHNEEDLGLFVKDPTSKHGRENLCRQCKNERENKRNEQRMKQDDRYYLRTKFRNMKKRCCNKNTIRFERYGGRGIIISQAWLDNPDLFVEWALRNGWQRGLTIERMNNDGPYSPENCCWIPLNSQSKNRSPRYAAVHYRKPGLKTSTGEENGNRTNRGK